MKLSRFSFTYILTPLLLLGCAATPQHAYEGPERALSEVAKLTCAPTMNIYSIDSDKKFRHIPVLTMIPCDFRLQPGAHIIETAFFAGGSYGWTQSKGTVPIKYEFEAGKTYLLTREDTRFGWRPKIVLVENSNNENVQK